MKLEYSRQIFEKYSNFMKILQWERICSIADEQTNTTKLIVGFCSFAKAPKMVMRWIQL